MIYDISFANSCGKLHLCCRLSSGRRYITKFPRSRIGNCIRAKRNAAVCQNRCIIAQRAATPCYISPVTQGNTISFCRSAVPHSTAAVSTPCAEDLCVAHYEVVQVGRSAAAVLAVTTAGYVRTRVARVRTGLSRENAAALAALLNRNLTFVAPVDLSSRLLAELCSQIDPELVPVISAAAAILQDSAQPHVFLGGEQHLLDWPQLEGRVGDILTLLNDEEQAAHIIAPPAERSESVLLGEDLEPQIPGLCIVSDRYLVGGGLWGTVALIGPTRMPFQKLMPLLHLFADELGEGMSGKRKDTPQMAAPRRTVIYKEDLE